VRPRGWKLRLPGWKSIGHEQFGADVDRGSAQEAYRRFVADARGASYNPWEATMGQIYLGSAQFCEKMQGLVGAPFDAIVRAVAESFGMPAEALRHSSRGPARKTLALLAAEEGGMTDGAVAKWMSVSAWAVSKL
jgi:hypothetical protein